MLIKEPKLHMIGNAHIDPVWLWQWPEGCQEVLATYRSALDRLNEDAAFTFVASSSAFYEWVEEHDPAMFAEIQARIAEGRWEPVGGWWIEPDCNLPGGESFVRQALYGQRYLREKFGRIAHVGYNVDSFGHHAMLPQLLLKSGLDSYIFLRPSPHEKGLPGRLFWWESDDGSRVLAFRIPYEYCAWGRDLEPHIRRCAAELKNPANALMCFYGVGNHGGGPTQENIQSIHRLSTVPDLPGLTFSTPERYFAEIRARQPQLPTVHDELQHHASGCYAAHSAVKRWNRRAENALLVAEKLAALAQQLTGHANTADFKRAWKNVLFNQFHDILAGTSLAAAYDDAANLYGEALAIAQRGLNAAVQAVAWRIQIPSEPAGRPLVVFNPLTWAHTANIELEIAALQPGEGLIDDRGEAVPLQKVRSRAAARGRDRISFLADLPALGYRTYRIVPGIEPADPSPLQAGDTWMENNRFRLEFDPATGALARLFDRVHQVELLLEPARAVVIDDPSDTWSHNVLRFDRELESFTATGVRCVARGPVKTVIRVISTCGPARLIQDFTLYQDLPQIVVHVTLDWPLSHSALKLRFPLRLDFARATYEIPYGTIERPVNGEEQPGQSWVDLSGIARDRGIPYGLSLLNDGKYSFDIHNKVLSLTVLRSPLYAHHIPFVPAPETADDYEFIDQGRQHFTYALLPHPGNRESSDTVRRAAELNQAPIVLPVTYRPAGILPPAAGHITVHPENVGVTVLKRAEEGDGWILRAVETTGNAAEACIELPAWHRTLHTRFTPWEIKTFHLPDDLAHSIAETNLLEEVDSSK